MSKLIITALSTMFLFSAGLAEAGDRGHRKSHRNHYAYSHNRHAYRPRHYGRHNYGYGYNHHSSRHHLRDGLKVAAGALLLGSIIHATTRPRHETVVVRRRAAPASNPDYWYRVDNEGACVEVTLNQQGQEVWTYVDGSNCQ